MRIPLGTYSVEVGREIQEKFTELRNKISERSLLRFHGYMLLRGRGKRNLYIRADKHPQKWTREQYRKQGRGAELLPVCNNYDRDVPLEFASEVAIYLVIDVGLMQKKNGKAKAIWQGRWIERQNTNLKEVEENVGS